MNKTASIVIFIILAVALIAAGVWYSGIMSQANVAGDAGQAANNTGQTVQNITQANSNVSSTNMEQNNLQIKDDVVGTGAEAKNGDTVTVNYVGTLDNGTKFDSSYDRKQPFSFILGAGQVIQGWDKGVLGMKVGGKRELIIPPDLGYGASGAGGVIPPNATLHFTVELLSVGK